MESYIHQRLYLKNPNHIVKNFKQNPLLITTKQRVRIKPLNNYIQFARSASPGDKLLIPSIKNSLPLLDC